MERLDFMKNITNKELLEEYDKLYSKTDLELLYLKEELKQLINQCKKDNIQERIIYLMNDITYKLINFFDYSDPDLAEEIKIFKNILKLERECLNKLSIILKQREEVNYIIDVYLYLSALETIMTSSLNDYNILLKKHEMELKNIDYYKIQDNTLEENENNMIILEQYIKKLKI
jgi:hypothetical protein